jgi:hypothetical protein
MESLMVEFRLGEPLSKTSISLVDNTYFDILNTSTWSYNIETIAQSLSNICRFNGHIENFYSVAEHAVRVAKTLRSWGASELVQFIGLHHDDMESIIGDIPSPHKHLLMFDTGDFIAESMHDLEKTLEYSFFTAIGVLGPVGKTDFEGFERDWSYVKRADVYVYLKERAERPILGKGLAPHKAKTQYLKMHEELAESIGLL